MFSCVNTVCLKATDPLKLKLCIFSWHTASFKIGVSKVQDFGNFEFSPMTLLSLIMRGNFACFLSSAHYLAICDNSDPV